MASGFRHSLPERRVFLNLMAVKLLLGSAVFEAPASLRTAKQELARQGFPSRVLAVLLKVLDARHFDMDAV